MTHPVVGERRLEALRHALGPAVLEALQTPDVVEILANPDGRLVLDRLGSGRADTGVILSFEARERIRDWPGFCRSRASAFRAFCRRSPRRRPILSASAPPSSGPWTTMSGRA
ncbi:hypothetical protein ACIQTU_10105 [Brevundimonas sp. NPDC090276]|uniref:hypothetical protein n=1 Tax=Brevundimonas sp. NPDC090276 TaxID=3363956 RepID=UPI00383AEF49